MRSITRQLWHTYFCSWFVLLLGPRQAQLVHLDRQLEDIVEALTLGLRLGHVVPPDVSAAVSWEPEIG